jgi:hypothetical protein
MAGLVSNTVYLKVDTVNVSAFYTDVKLSAKNSVRDNTAGSAATHVSKAAGLDEYSFDLTLIYDDTSLATYLSLLKPGSKYVFEIGTEGNTAGKPRHQQTCIVESVSTAIKVDKDLIAFSISISGAAAPTVNMFAGGVY